MKMFRQDIQDCSIFDGFSAHDLDMLTSAFEPCRFPAGSTIIEQGQPTDYLYILSSGRVIIHFKPYDGPPFSIATIAPGDVFGWSVALGKSTYTSAAIAEEDCQAYRLSKERLKLLGDRYPELVSVLMERLVDRIIQRAQSAQGEIFNVLIDGIDRNGKSIRRPGKNGRSDA